MQTKKVPGGRGVRAGLAGVVLAAGVALSACSVPSGTFTQVQYDSHGNAIHCTYQKIWHPNIPFNGYGWFEHRFIGGPPACTGN